MNLATAFWVILLVWVIFGAYRSRADLKGFASDNLVLLVLLALLGWATFGPILHR